jgi:2',3'-cyclic-nucleotide 2'-phosphodiesterase (5'-nucleotidase family)
VLLEPDRPRLEARARLVLRGLTAVQTEGLVVGERDVTAGLPFLIAAAAEAKVPLMSANLRDANGKAPFTGHRIVSAGALKIGLVALSQPTGYPEGIHGEDPAQAARDELQRLAPEQCDLKILLAHLARTDLDRVLKEAPGFDLAAVAHEGWQGPPQSSSGIPVVYVGQRGRSISRLDLETAGGAEPLVDLGAIERNRQEAETLDRRIQDTKKQMAAYKGATVDSFKKTLETLERRRRDLSAGLRKDNAYHHRVFQADAVNLGPDVADDPEVQKDVKAYLAKYPADASDQPPFPPGFFPRGGPLPAGAFPLPLPGTTPGPNAPPVPPMPPRLQPPPPAPAAPLRP